MATSPLLEALSGARYSANEDPFGIGAQALGASMPHLVNQYSTPGRNFGTVLGASLLAGILGGYAKKRTNEANQTLMSDAAMLLKSPGSRDEIIAKEPRLNELASALQMQEYSNNIEQQQKQQERQLESQQKIDEFRSMIPLEAERAGSIKQAETAAEGGLTPAMRTNLVEEQGAKQEQGNLLGFVDQEFEKAKGISSLGALVPMSDASQELDGVQGSLRTVLQKYLGREMNGPEQEKIVKLMPDWNDTEVQIEMKKARFKEMMASMSKSTPLLDALGGNQTSSIKIGTPTTATSTPTTASKGPESVPPGMKLQRNKVTGETRLVPL